MSSHPDFGPEFRQLAQTILDRLDPAVRFAAARAAAAGAGPGKCQQVWCPVCALAALATGEQHPLLSLVAEHSVALMTMLRSMVAETQPSDPATGPLQTDGAPNGAPAPGQGRYQHIPITVED